MTPPGKAPHADYDSGIREELVDVLDMNMRLDDRADAERVADALISNPPLLRALARFSGGAGDTVPDDALHAAIEVVAAELDEAISEFVTQRDELHGFEADPREAARVAVEALVANRGVLAALAPSGGTPPRRACDEMCAEIDDANTRMGEALVEIGMALGLPRPTVQHHWGAPEILARIRER